MSGWIKIHRDIKKNWIFHNPEYFKAWITIIMTVNHEHKKVLIDNQLINCERDQSVKSLNSWVDIFGKNWSIQKVRTFFKLLNNDKMIVVEGMRKTTKISVCNYHKYQDTQHTDNIQITHSQHTDNTQVTTKKNEKNEKNEKNDKNDKNVDDIFKNYPTRCHHSNRATGKCSKNKNQILKLLRDKTKEEIIEIQNLYISDCDKSKTYYKSYSTFLNNFPDKEQFEKSNYISKPLHFSHKPLDLNKYDRSKENE